MIEDLSLVAEPGQTVAIVGPTGAGKTTLVNLVMRFYEVGSGRITLDGAGHREPCRGQSSAARSGWCSRTPGCSAGRSATTSPTGDPTATEEEILEAAQATYVDRFVHSLPDGYDTVIDEEGSERLRRREAAAHDRAGVPGRSRHPDPRRGDELGRHPHRAADPARDGGAALGPHSVRDRAPALDHPRRRPDPRDGGRPHRRAGLRTMSCWPRTGPTRRSTTPSSRGAQLAVTT